MNKEPIQALLLKHAQSLCNDVQRTWNSLASIDGEAKVTAKGLSTNDNSVACQIEAEGQKAWIAEYGKGSLMDKSSDNPYLERYYGSDKWNPLRDTGNNVIVGRRAGEYQDLDGKTYTSSGKRAGIKVEPHIQPVKGQHVIEKTLSSDSGLNQVFKSTLQELIEKQIKKHINIEVIGR